MLGRGLIGDGLTWRCTARRSGAPDDALWLAARPHHGHVRAHYTGHVCRSLARPLHGLAISLPWPL